MFKMFYIEESNRKTKYCRRVDADGISCKEKGVELSPDRFRVVEAFTKIKGKMYKRYINQENADHELTLGLTYDEYRDWLDKAVLARQDFYDGNISADEAMRIFN